MAKAVKPLSAPIELALANSAILTELLGRWLHEQPDPRRLSAHMFDSIIERLEEMPPEFASRKEGVRALLEMFFSTVDGSLDHVEPAKAKADA